VGSGIGSAIVIDNKIYRGTNNFAGEVGHTIICNKEYEDLAAGFSIKENFKQKYKKMAKYFAIGLSNLINILDPKVVYVCGSVGREYIKNKKTKKIINKILRKYCLNKKIKIKLAHYKNPALAGAILL
jgi:predicted NBD/HSP70 family sugar kinase